MRAQSSARPLSLPAPSRRYRVGEVDLHLVDHARSDPWQPAQSRRELMVSVFHPATQTAGRPAAPYMLPSSAAHFDDVTGKRCLPRH